jgi:hypothetical protein
MKKARNWRKRIVGNILLIAAIAAIAVLTLNTGTLAFILVIALIVALRAVLKNPGREARTNAQGEFILEYGLGMRVFAAIGLTATAGLLVWALAGDLSRFQKLFDLALLAVLAIFLFLSIYFFFLTNFGWYGVSNYGVKRHDPLRREIMIQWNEVVSVGYDKGFIISAPHKKVRLDEYVGSQDVLAKLIKKNVAETRRVRAAKQIESLEQLLRD